MSDFFSMTTADLIMAAAGYATRADNILNKLESLHPPERMARFFPSSTAPVPDAGYAKRFGQETLTDVMSAAEAVIFAAEVREELEIRRHPN